MGIRCVLLLLAVFVLAAACALYPQESETRELFHLDGVWRFTLGGREEYDQGFRQRWYQHGLPKWQAMAVPASYNDITASAELRDHVGWAWYERDAFARARWAEEGTRVFLRFGSVHYFAYVWVNGQLAGNHSGGHLPFDFDVTGLRLKFGSSNRITVAVNNTLSPLTIPQGTTQELNGSMYPANYSINSYTFDFFNYAGIHRSVYLYTVPHVYIEDVRVTTELVGTVGVVGFFISYQIPETADNLNITCKISLMDGVNEIIQQSSLCAGEIYINGPKLWWPVHMSDTPGYMYDFQIELLHDGKRVDLYRLPVGIRTIKWNETNILINDKPIYLYGFGKHEDSILRGKGLDYTLLVRDYSLIEWIGANSYRTSHYPYAEEALDFADRQGILIIAESPAVNLQNFDDALLEIHKSVLSEMVKRDKNRPSVVMWSLSNEAVTSRKRAGPYYEALVKHMKNLDMSRPVGYVTNQNMDKDNAAQFMDFIGLNRYFSWYTDTGHLDLVANQVETEYSMWYKKFHKPIFVSEYGADTIAGFHELPAFVWTEDYQVALLHEYFKAFDVLQEKGFFLGEMIWNFADFGTRQDVRRAQGNKKGIFTRERQPKHAAYILKERYHSLGKKQIEKIGKD